MTADWQDFFGTLAQVAITAFSVMFLSMQIRSKEWRISRLRRVAAISALVELFVPVLVGMIAVMGANPWKIAALTGGVMGLGMVAYHVGIYRFDRSQDDVTAFDVAQARGTLLSLLVYLAVALSPALPTPAGLYVLAGACTWLLFSGSFEAWWLLDPRGLDQPRSQTNAAADREPASGESHPPFEPSSGSTPRDPCGHQRPSVSET